MNGTRNKHVNYVHITPDRWQVNESDFVMKLRVHLNHVQNYTMYMLLEKMFNSD